MNDEERQKELLRIQERLDARKAREERRVAGQKAMGVAMTNGMKLVAAVVVALGISACVIILMNAAEDKKHEELRQLEVKRMAEELEYENSLDAKLRRIVDDNKEDWARQTREMWWEREIIKIDFTGAQPSVTWIENGVVKTQTVSQDVAQMLNRKSQY